LPGHDVVEEAVPVHVADREGVAFVVLGGRDEVREERVERSSQVADGEAHALVAEDPERRLRAAGCGGGHEDEVWVAVLVDVEPRELRRLNLSLTSVAGSASDVISSKSPMPAVGLYLRGAWRARSPRSSRP